MSVKAKGLKQTAVK